MFLHVSVILFTGVGGLQAHTWREVEGSDWGGGFSRPTPRGLAGGCVSEHALRQTHPQQMATHPTGMHSCCIFVLISTVLFHNFASTVLVM